ncbi:MAG: hypothetical protein RIC55_04885 [Pirellulaceae bacterium]
MGRSFADFFDGLVHFSEKQLDAHQGSVYGLTSDLHIAYVNPAWDRFAAENAGEPAIGRSWNLGASWLDAIPEVLRQFFLDLLASSRAGKDSLHPVSHDYECSSDETFRRFHMDVYPLRADAGYLIVNSLLVEEPHPNACKVSSLNGYADSDGVIHQCAHCRRVEHQRVPSRWDFIPQWVKSPPQSVSHSICPICLDHYYQA